MLAITTNEAEQTACAYSFLNKAFMTVYLRTYSVVKVVRPPLMQVTLPVKGPKVPRALRPISRQPCARTYKYNENGVGIQEGIFLFGDWGFIWFPRRSGPLPASGLRADRDKEIIQNLKNLKLT